MYNINLKNLLKEAFNDFSNCLNGTYWEIERQRDNAVLHHAYALLEQKALSEGDSETAMRLRNKREQNCDLPNVNDPTYKGSRREWQDKVDAGFKAKELGENIANEQEKRGIPKHPNHALWMEQDLMPILDELSNTQKQSLEFSVLEY